MAINYRKQESRNGTVTTFVESRGHVTFRQLCDHIYDHTHLFDRALIQHVVSKVAEVLVDCVCDNYSVSIDGIGRFRPSVTKDGKSMKVSVNFMPEKNTFLKKLREQKLKELTPDMDMYPKRKPISEKEQERIRKILQRERKNN